MAKPAHYKPIVREAPAKPRKAAKKATKKAAPTPPSAPVDTPKET